MSAEHGSYHLEAAVQGRLTLRDGAGHLHEGVLPVRLFPLTDPEHWVSLVGPDGVDLWCIEDPAGLPVAAREVLREALAYREFVPQIQVVHSIRRAAHGYLWDVGTDLGRVSFTVENDESIQTLGGGSIVIIDQRNTRYLIPRPGDLDPRSRQRLERYY